MLTYTPKDHEIMERAVDDEVLDLSLQVFDVEVDVAVVDEWG